MPEEVFIYFSHFAGRSIVSSNGVVLGKLFDFAFDLSGEAFPRARKIVIKNGFFSPKYAEISTSQVHKIADKIYLKCESKDVVFQKEELHLTFMLRRDVLDQQIVDVENKKVVRVNDVHLLKVDNQLHLAHVDVGLRALISRLDWGPFVDFIVRLVNKDAPYLKEEELVSWKNSQVLAIGSKQNVLRLDVARAKIAKIPSVKLAEMMEDLDIFEQALLFRSLSFDVQLQVFTDMPPDEKIGLLDQLEDHEAANLIAKIPSDEATDLLMDLPKSQKQQLMRLMGSQTSKKLRTLLGYREDSAGGLMTMEYLSLSSRSTVKDAVELIKSSVDFSGNIMNIYVVDDQGRYLGTTTIRRVINEDVDKPILDVCAEQKVFVYDDDNMEKVALLIEQYKYSAIPVVDEINMLLGSITVDDVVEELITLAWGKYKDQI